MRRRKNQQERRWEGVAILERAGRTDGRCLNKELREVSSPSDTWGRSLPSRQVLGRAQGAERKASAAAGEEARKGAGQVCRMEEQRGDQPGPYRALCALALQSEMGSEKGSDIIGLIF